MGKTVLHTAGNERGSVLNVALLILTMLALVGIVMSITSSTEVRIAGNEKAHLVAFYNADSGIYATPKLIASGIEDGQDPALGANESVSLLDDEDNKFFREIMGFTNDSEAGFTPDVSYDLGDFSTSVDVRRTGQMTLAGGGAEFGSGAEGVGTGSTGGVAILYAFESIGRGPYSAQVDITVAYRKVPGTAGGL